MNANLPKPVKRQMNALIDKAHELALRNALEELNTHFNRWRRGEIDSFELQDLIHKFHDGQSREIYNRFSDRRTSQLPIATAYAVANGLIDEKDVPPEVMPFIATLLRFWRE